MDKLSFKNHKIVFNKGHLFKKKVLAWVGYETKH